MGKFRILLVFIWYIMGSTQLQATDFVTARLFGVLGNSGLFAGKSIAVKIIYDADADPIFSSDETKVFPTPLYFSYSVDNDTFSDLYVTAFTNYDGLFLTESFFARSRIEPSYLQPEVRISFTPPLLNFPDPSKMIAADDLLASGLSLTIGICGDITCDNYYRTCLDIRCDTYTTNASAVNLDTTVLAVNVPEPETWGMSIAGFCLIGVTLRRRTHAASARSRRISSLSTKSAMPHPR